jgi:hypothetical protein
MDLVVVEADKIQDKDMVVIIIIIVAIIIILLLLPLLEMEICQVQAIVQDL